jgi:signal peptidase I
MSQNKEKKTFSERLHAPAKQWVKAILWSLLYVLFIVWVGSFWWLLLLPLIFDAFVTHFIPWTWWQQSENKTLRAAMGWIDAIVFALVAVYFINLYLFQNYQIPTSSLEKSLMVGDFLFVSKASYGPRIPNTPLSFPLVQNTFPFINTKSYIDKPQWEYRRLKGIDNIKRNDIVVFNFPTGDTVPLNVNNPDFYTLSFSKGVQEASKRGMLKNANIMANGFTAKDFQSVGREYIVNHPEEYGEIVWRPVDKRENYVKRCVGMPGDELKIVDNQIFVNGTAQPKFEGIQYCYVIQTQKDTYLSETVLANLGISKEDIAVSNGRVGQMDGETFFAKGLSLELPTYILPLTEEMLQKISKFDNVKTIVLEPASKYDFVFPLGNDYGWNRDNYGPINIPAKGQVFELTLQNLPIYERAITVYENNKLEVKDGKIFINDVETHYYTFKMDYYWMMGDNRHNSADSRYWGFVPEDHIVGRPVFVWLSLNKDKGLFSGKIRWNRIFKGAER